MGEERRRRRAFYESLPYREFPSLVELAEPMTTIASEEQFEWGLRALSEGFAALRKQAGEQSERSFSSPEPKR